MKLQIIEFKNEGGICLLQFQFEFSFSLRFHHPLGPDIWNFDLTQFPKRFGQIHPSWP